MRQKLNIGILLTLGAILGSCFFYTQRAHAGALPVYISQVQITGGSGHTNDDFVELFNPNSQAVNLKGYRLVKRTAAGTVDTLIKSWTSDTIIPPFSFYLWANTGCANLPYPADGTTSGTLSDDNGVAVRFGASDSGALIDSISWGKANNTFRNVSAQNPGAGLALQRQDLYTENSNFSIAASHPRNSSVADKPAPPSSGGTATSTPQSETPAAVTVEGTEYKNKAEGIVFSELLVNPEGEDGGQEVVELENTGLEAADLRKWILRDGSGTSTVDFTIGSVQLLPGDVATITLPAGSFALDNQGDAIALLYPDGSQADALQYKGPAPERLSYQKYKDGWVWSLPSLGRKNFTKTYIGQSGLGVRISEVLANPVGEDEGKEWVELLNLGEEAIPLAGYRLDDAGTTLGPSNHAVALDDQGVLLPGEFLVVAIPEDAFQLKNDHGELRLFDAQQKMADAVTYEEAPEGKSYARSADGAWAYGIPTPGAASLVDQPLSGAFISELLPNPGEGREEFMELGNASLEPVLLKDLVLGSDSQRKALEKDVLLQPGQLFVFGASELPFSLRNSGGRIELFDQYGRRLSAVDYPAAPAGQSYSRDSGGSFFWTDVPTPGTANTIIQAAAVEKEPAATVPASRSVSEATVYKRLYAQQQELNARLEGELAALQQSVALLGPSENRIVEQVVPTSDTMQTAPTQHREGWLYGIISLLALVLAILLYRRIA